MGQKVHPLGFRLGVTEDHKSKWFTKLNNYVIDLLIKRYIYHILVDILKIYR